MVEFISRFLLAGNNGFLIPRGTDRLLPWNNCCKQTKFAGSKRPCSCFRFGSDNNVAFVCAVFPARIINVNRCESVDVHSRLYFLANVRDDRSPPAFGADPASAGSVTKVPKAWGFGRSLCSGYLFFFRGSTIAPSGNMRTEPGNEASLELKPIVKYHLSASEATAPVLSAR